MQGQNSDKILLMLSRIGMHNQTPKENVQIYVEMATLNQHPPAYHPLDDRYYSLVDEPQLR
jgi:hypothetical protein